MRCEELQAELSDLTREPSATARAHLETCAECRVWLDTELNQPMDEMRQLPEIVPPTVFARVTLPEAVATGDSFWKALVWKTSLGLVVVGVLILMLTPGMPQRSSTTAESWSFLTPAAGYEWSFMEVANGFENEEAPLEQREQVGEFEFLDDETTYTFLEEEQS